MTLARITLCRWYTPLLWYDSLLPLGNILKSKSSLRGKFLESKKKKKSSIAAHSCDPRLQEAEARELPWAKRSAKAAHWVPGQPEHQQCLGARDMAQRLAILAALPQCPSLISSTYMVAHNHPVLRVWYLMTFVDTVHIWHSDTHAGNKIPLHTK